MREHNAISWSPAKSDAQMGIDKIRAVIRQPLMTGYELGGVATAVGHSRCDDALDLLLELGSDPERAKLLGDAWTDSVAAVGTQAAKEVLISFVDPAVRQSSVSIDVDHQNALAATSVDG